MKPDPETTGPDSETTGRDTLKESGMPHYRTPLAYKIECLTSQGYDKEFFMTDKGLICSDTNEVFLPEDIKIVEHQRFEGISDPDDMAILYIIETKSGLKGTVVDAFGTYADPDLFYFMRQVTDGTINSVSNPEIKDCWNIYQG